MKWLPWFRRRAGGENLLPHKPLEDEFLWLEGRRHVKDLPYLMPIDQQEMNRLDFQHYLIRYVMQRNYVAPIVQPDGILDVGCGTGRWAYEMAEEFPQSRVFGLDVTTDYQVQAAATPKNYRFVRGNVLEELPFPDNTFDFVHQRFLHVAIPTSSWTHVIRELKRVTRLNGWIELAESDQRLQNVGPATQQLATWGSIWSKKRDIDPGICIHLADFLDQSGFQNIQQYKINLPLGSWGGRIGTMTATDIFSYNRAMKPMITKQLNIPPDEFDRLSEMMRQEWETYHSYFSFYITCGQRIS